MKTFLFQRLHHPPFQKKKGRYMRSDFNVEDEFMEDDWEADEDDSEIDGDCNESQPCRGDEPWLDQQFFACSKGETSRK